MWCEPNPPPAPAEKGGCFQVGRQLRAGKDQVPSSAPLGPSTFGLKHMKVWPMALRITGMALGFPNRVDVPHFSPHSCLM